MVTNASQPRLSRDDIDAIFRETFPAKAERASLEYVTTSLRDDGDYGIVLRLIIWDALPDGTQTIRDIKEQECWFDPHDVSPERLAAFGRAHTYVASLALAHPEVDTLMPHDVWKPHVLQLSKPQTEEQFVKALSVKSRFGKLLPAAP